MVSASTAFIRACAPNTAAGRTFPCELCVASLAGTGFGLTHNNPGATGGSTGWLTSRAPVIPGETVVLRFAIWDAHVDSTVLIDHLRWDLVEGEGAMGDEPADAGPTTVPVLI